MAVILEIDNTNRLVAHHILSRGYHYGATPTLESGRKGFMVYRGGETGESQTVPEMLEFEDNGARPVLLRRRSVPEYGDVHQIMASPRGLLVADTANNRFVIETREGVREHVFGEIRQDVNHVNSVFLAGDDAVTLLHNKRSLESQLAVFQIRGAALRLEGVLSLWDVLCHNVFVDGDRLLYLASHANTLVSVNLASDRMERRVVMREAEKTLPSGRAHVKGLSVTDGIVAVGVSEFADRAERRTAIGCLVLLDRRTLGLRAIVDLDTLGEPIGNINEVRALDGLEEGCWTDRSVGQDWSSLRLARRDRLGFAMRRLQLLLLSPAVRLRRLWRHRAA